MRRGPRGKIDKRDRSALDDQEARAAESADADAAAPAERARRVEHGAGGDADAAAAGSEDRMRVSAARRHNVDDAVDRVVDEEAEEWEDDTESDGSSIPEEIIDEAENFSDSDDDDDDGGEGGGGGGGGGGDGTIGKNDGGGERKVRFAGGLTNDDDGVARVWRSDKESKDPNVQLTFSNRAYESFFQLRTEFPCLSFSVLRDFDGDCRTKYPMSMYLACGTQAAKKNDNRLVLLHVSNLVRTKYDEASDSDDDEEIGMAGDSSDDSDSDSDAEEVNNGEAVVNARSIAMPGAINRLRCKEDAPNMIACWCDDGTVRVVDALHDARALADFTRWSEERAANWDKAPPNPHVFTSTRGEHRTEGYGLGWARAGNLGVFASGDNNGHIVAWTPNDAGSWSVLAACHREAPSVEEIVWSPTEASVFIAARAGGAVEVWDTRDMRAARVSWRADPTDINVADWNRAMSNSHLVVTGADSGMIAVWDLRKVQHAQPAPLQMLNFHRGSSITSVEFSVHNETVISATSSDGQCTLWDLCVERDIDEEREMVGNLFGRPDVSELPDALMFQHQGLLHPKECHMHPQIPGAVITTDYNGLHFFKPCNWKSLMK